MNHLTLGIYPNKSYKWNVVKDDDLDAHIEYNLTFRPGRIFYVDNNRLNTGLLDKNNLSEYDKIAYEFFKSANNTINMEIGTIPYQ